MATSGSVDFNQTRNEIIEAALRKCGQLAEGETATAQQTQDASEDLERLVKLWQAIGLHLWKYKNLVVFTEKNKAKYTISETGDRIVDEDNLKETTTTADALSGASSVSVASISGITDGDIIGIVNGTQIFWTTVDGSPAGSVVSLDDNLTEDISSGSTVYAFTSKEPKFLRMIGARALTTPTSEIDMGIIGREDYFGISNKKATGIPVEVYYNPLRASGELFVWPMSNDERILLKLNVEAKIEDFDNADNNADFPDEWIQALIWNLAEQIAPEYGVSDRSWARIQYMAGKTYKVVKEFDAETADITFEVDFGD
jgi:hypothetical protein